MMDKILNLTVKTSQPKTKILEKKGNDIKIAVAAPPREGKANQEIIKFFSRKYKTTDVSIISGMNTKRKVIKIIKQGL